MTSITNATTGRVLVEQLEDARGWWGRFRGLMLRSSLPAGSGLRIEPCGSIHMMFMRFPIDAVFYDRSLSVKRVHHGVRPWIGFAMGGRGARGVLELPPGAADGVERGHQLQLVPDDD